MINSILSNWIFRRRLLLSIAILIASSGQAGAQDIAPKSADELAAAAMRLDQGQGGIESIETTITATAAQGIIVDVRVAKTGPNWLAVYNKSDGTPLMLCGQDRTILYDVMEGVVRVYHSAHFGVALWSEAHHLEAHFDLRPDDDHALLDIRSFVLAASDQRQAIRAGDSWVLSGFTPRRAKLIAHIVPSQRNPYSDFQIISPSGKEVVLAVGPILVNQPPTRQPAPFPDEKMLAKRIKVIDLPSPWATPAQHEEAQKAQEGTLLALAGIEDATIRSDIEKQYAKPIDWPSLKTRNVAMSAVLRQLAGRTSPASAALETQPTNVPK